MISLAQVAVNMTVLSFLREFQLVDYFPQTGLWACLWDLFLLTGMGEHTHQHHRWAVPPLSR